MALGYPAAGAAGLNASARPADSCAGVSSAQEQALGIYRDVGARGGEVTALNERGALHRGLRRDAARCTDHMF
jgi:hypothetical protein